MFGVWLAAGFLLLVLGVLFSSMGAGLIFAPRSLHWWPHKNPIAQLLGGATLLAFGGITASFAWDLRSSTTTRAMIADARAEEITASRNAKLMLLSAEVAHNSEVLQSPFYTETDPEKLKEFTVFPALSDEALNEFLGSGLFLGEGDAALLSEARDLKVKLQFFETMRISANFYMQRGGTENWSEIRADTPRWAFLVDVKKSLGRVATKLDAYGSFSIGPRRSGMRP